MAGESGEKLLTQDEAAQRTKDSITRGGTKDYTHQLDDPLTETDSLANAPNKAPTQTEVAMEQSLDKGKTLREVNPPKASETPAKKINRLTREEPL